MEMVNLALREGMALGFVLAIAACGASASSAAASPYRFAVKPVVIFAPDGKAWDFGIFVRLNRDLPRTSRGVRAHLAVDGLNQESPPTTLTHRRPCYAATQIFTGDTPPPASLKAPKDGQEVTVTLSVAGGLKTRRKVKARRVPRRTFAATEALARETARVGCPVGSL
jgi:hypothetical protein